MNNNISILHPYHNSSGTKFIDESYDKYVLFVFISDWLGVSEMIKTVYCKVMGQSEVPIKIYTVNISEDEEIAKRYRVSKLPATIIFRKGEIVDKFEGVIKKSDILKRIYLLQESFNKKPS